MTNQPQDRPIFWDWDEVPKGTKVLGIKVKIPILTVVAGAMAEHRFPLLDEQMVFVEITPEEWSAVKEDPQAANVLARQFGRLVQRSLGASWHRWHDSNVD
jgi:hypothetical protein